MSGISEVDMRLPLRMMKTFLGPLLTGLMCFLSGLEVIFIFRTVGNGLNFQIQQKDQVLSNDPAFVMLSTFQFGMPNSLLNHQSSSTGHVSVTRSTPGEPLSYSEDIMKHLNIPAFLADCSEQSLRFAYQKYKAFLIAVKILDEKWKAGELPYNCKPLNEHIIETMQSKTYWYDYTRKYFSKVGAYPEMVAWLENDEGVPMDLEIWGIEKKSYSFGDLDTYLKKGVGGGKQSHKK